ncbi:DUF4360 domain-containing protein [Actinomadura graeca]|uniref:DUF4360 domain-containing protein n=1 Tax=Actinomadura graeca TaxID=2750812 RepID=A0ABX8QZT1_9ACTN|nr:DUF4360 domain-containing protein [Actinomadura graeca]QXJ23227.1 DUF4360 domain-containing protein [Actinomadura graeca]
MVAAAALPLVTAGPAAADPPPDGITIEIATVNGGCPAGSVSVSISEDKSSFQVAFGDLTASVGGDSPPSAAKRICRLNLRIHAPQGYTYEITAIEQSGAVNLEAGASAQVTQQYYIQGKKPDTDLVHVLTGPSNRDWVFRDTIPSGAMPCGEQRNLNLATELQANLGTSDASKKSSIWMSSGTGLPGVRTAYPGRVTYSFGWTKCTT